MSFIPGLHLAFLAHALAEMDLSSLGQSFLYQMQVLISTIVIETFDGQLKVVL